MSDYTSGKGWKIAKRQHIMEAAFQLFSERGIEPVNMQEIAQAGGVSRATLFRYFPSKLDLVVAIGTWKWMDYIEWHNASLLQEMPDSMNAAAQLRFLLDAFLDLYRNHSDILRFNYIFNSFLRYEGDTSERKQPYMRVVDMLGRQFHEVYLRGLRDGTLNTDISERIMFSSSFHIMLAAVTRYAVGLVYENGARPEDELIMLEELLLSRFTRR